MLWKASALGKGATLCNEVLKKSGCPRIFGVSQIASVAALIIIYLGVDIDPQGTCHLLPTPSSTAN